MKLQLHSDVRDLVTEESPVIQTHGGRELTTYWFPVCAHYVIQGCHCRIDRKASWFLFCIIYPYSIIGMDF